jgi:hypothetical protein
MAISDGHIAHAAAAAVTVMMLLMLVAAAPGSASGKVRGSVSCNLAIWLQIAATKQFAASPNTCLSSPSHQRSCFGAR